MDIVIVANFCLDFSDADNGRFSYLANLLSMRGHQVEIVTSLFDHATKKIRHGYNGTWPFKITFLPEIGYKKNISIRRFVSHYVWGKNVQKYLNNRKKPDVIYCAIPSLTAPYYVAKYCEKNDVKFIIDVQDLWPEAFKMVLNIPLISDIIFLPFAFIANASYKRADEIIAVSQTYAERAIKVSKKCMAGHVVFLGTNLSTFDKNVSNFFVAKKNDKELWLGYCGTLGASYDLITVFDALRIIKEKGHVGPKFIIMGSGPRELEFKERAKGLNVEFMGKLPYPQMCGLIASCDIVVNPIVHNAAQSIINKHADYAAAGLPVISTQENMEYKALVKSYEMGVNVSNGNPEEMANAFISLMDNPEKRIQMGKNARKCAEELFDREYTYTEILNVI